jgi:peptidoglycan hydrolase-like protein with peptidoglycan-binding domain
VKTIQKLLNEHAKTVGYASLPIDGVSSPPVIQAIRTFQQKIVGMRSPDGRVDPAGKTLRHLNEPPALFAPIAGSFATTGKTFKERLDAFLAAAKATYGVEIPAGTEFRRAEDAQKWHVAHMIYYNSYANLKPSKWELVGGRRLIAWSHLESAATVWQYVTWQDILRDANGQPPVKQGAAWAAGRQPDKAKTRQRAYDVLKNARIGTAKDRASELHSAMVAPGYQGCAEPCRCGGKRSNHVAGAASDLGKVELEQLNQKLQQAGAGSIDVYLKGFGLHRPMNSEPWHVEATSP